LVISWFLSGYLRASGGAKGEIDFLDLAQCFLF